uniref:Pyridoxal phosphate homeostasis protein n=1 Tax=Parastrongyloides trichosuri TaxID=131310 RepID=A0A0N4ZZ28_PARTI
MRKTVLENVYEPCKLPDICFNGGTCSNTGNDFECHCPTHYYGKHCQYIADLKHCSDNKCFTLKNKDGEIVLQSTCYSLEKPINVSNPDLRNPNINPSSIYVGGNVKTIKTNYQPVSIVDPETKAYIEIQYGCWCPKGRTGYFCEYEIKHKDCNHGTCNNHGIPEYDEGSKICKCTCENGWYGSFCDKETKCKGVFCGNGGTCDTNTGKCICVEQKRIFRDYPVVVSGEYCQNVEITSKNVGLKIPCEVSFMEYIQSLGQKIPNNMDDDTIVDLADMYQLVKNCNENRRNKGLKENCDEVLKTRNCYGDNSICLLKIWQAPTTIPGYELNYTGDPEVDFTIRSNKKNTMPTVIPSCKCDENSAGTFCELENVNPCKDKPCQNKGKCIPLKYLDYKCECVNGASGKNCEINDPCFKNPCEWPGSTCVRKQMIVGMTVSYSYDCICPQVDAHKRACHNSATGACLNHKCQNHGHCALCPDPYGSTDSCTPSEVQQGYRCICPFGYNDRYCREKATVCDYNYCQKNSTCVVDKENPLNYKCICKPGYSGKLCRILTDWCAYKGDKLCGANGYCKKSNETGAHFYCKCKDNYEGIYCDKLKSFSFMTFYHTNFKIFYPISLILFMLPLTIVILYIKDSLNERHKQFIKEKQENINTLKCKVSSLTQLEIKKLNYGYQSVTKIISECNKKFNRNATLVAVSKYYTAEHIKYLYLQHDVRIFGESRVKDLQEKAKYLEECCPDIKWHFIGKLQSNKIHQLFQVKNVDMIQTIEDKRYASLLNEAAEKLNFNDKSVNVMVQVNVSGESQKQGCEPSEVFEILEHIIDNCPKLNLSGLMTIGEKHSSDDKDTADDDFRRLYELKNQADINKFGTLKLSMGMSGDYDIAIKNGSDFVRVGTNLFDPEI